MPPVPTARQPLRGIALKLAAVAIFTAMSSLIRAASDHVPAGEAVFFRSFFACPVILVWLLWHGALGPGLRTHDMLGHV